MDDEPVSPSTADPRYPWRFKCNKPWCQYGHTTATHDEALAVQANHPCPTTGKTTLGWSVIMPAVKDLWELADQKYEEFTSLPSTDPRAQYIGGELRGMATALSFIMKPYFEDGDAIVREILARGEARKNGTPHTTPGIENVTLFPEEPTKWYPSATGTGFTHNPAFAENPPAGYPADRVAEARRAAAPPANSATARAATGTAAARRATTKAKRTFTPEEIEAINAAHASGFEMNMIQMAYSATEDEIRSVLKTA